MGLGRSPKYGQPLTERVNVLFTEEHLPQLNRLAAQSGTSDVSSWIREIALGERPHPAATHAAEADADSIRAKYLTAAPCGPWMEAIEHAGNFTLSPDVAEELEARDGDVVVRTVGDSMDGAGIHDHSLLLMRPLAENRLPRPGEIALVQITTADGECLGTIKRWKGGTPPMLHDGDGKEFQMPQGATEVKAVAVARGLISRLF